MRLIVGALMAMLAPPALAGGAYLQQDITGRWHYPELFPLDTRADAADDEFDERIGDPASPASGLRSPATLPATGRRGARTAQHP